MSKRKKMKRGAVRHDDSIFVGAWLPLSMLQAMDQAADVMDSDRSKFIRRALAEKIARANLEVV